MAKKIAKTRFNEIVAQKVNHVATHLAAITALVDEYPEHMTADDSERLQEHVVKCSNAMGANIENSLRRNDVESVEDFAFTKVRGTPRKPKAKAPEKPKEVVEKAPVELVAKDTPVEEAIESAVEEIEEKPPVVDELDDLGDLGDLDELLEGVA